MSVGALKQAAARAARQYIEDAVPENSIIGVGTGSTANFFIDELAGLKGRIKGGVASSSVTKQRLEGHGIRVFDLNDAGELPVYVDGADEINDKLEMIKGGGGALTREKIIAAAAKTFVCICDQSKLVKALGKFPLPVEVIPMARAQVSRALSKLGGQPRLREGFVTDNGNLILDVHGLNIVNAAALEAELNQITGVVCNGLFARRGADVLLLATNAGVKTTTR